MLSANIDKDTRKAVYRRDGFRCALCDSDRGLQVHHVIPRSHGGPDTKANLFTLCWRCHAAAHMTKLPEYPDYVDGDFIEQAIVEYLSDYYAEVLDQVWNPWEEGG